MTEKFELVGSLNSVKIFESPDLSNVKGGVGKPFWFDNIKIYTKKEMVEILNGRTVKCIFVEDDNYNIFGVQDIETKNVYLLDENI